MSPLPPSISRHRRPPHNLTMSATTSAMPSWTMWQPWSKCSVSCGYDGTRIRKRDCDHKDAVFCGAGTDEEHAVCNGPVCKVDGEKEFLWNALPYKNNEYKSNNKHTEMMMRIEESLQQAHGHEFHEINFDKSMTFFPCLWYLFPLFSHYWFKPHHLTLYLLLIV